MWTDLTAGQIGPLVKRDLLTGRVGPLAEGTVGRYLPSTGQNRPILVKILKIRLLV
jgi:hypothetical protein